MKFVSLASLAGLIVSLIAFSPSLQPARGQVSVTLGQNFTSSTFGTDTSGTPADSNGAIGSQHFAEFINGSFAVYNKTNGQSLKRISDLKFWSNAGLNLSATDGVADPRIVFDPASQRWFASMVDFDANATDPTLEANDFLLAVSATADPRGTWKGFLFEADPDTGAFADFPTLGVDSNGVYLSAEMYHGESNPLGSGLVSIPKADLLAATPTIANRTWFGVMDYSLRGQVLQPVNCWDGSSSGKLIATSDYGNDSDPHSNIVSFAVLNAGGTPATLTASTFIPTAPWVVPDSPYLPAPAFHPIQPDGSDTLVGNEARFSGRVSCVNGLIHAVHCTEVNGRVAIRWYRIRASDNSLLESGTISDPDLDFFYPSIAANSNGVVMICFNASGLSTYISCYAVAGQTANNTTTFGSRVLLQASTVSYHDFYEQLGLNDTSRWGDYSATTVDPTNPNHFWTIQMFALPDPTFDTVWATQITELITAPAVVNLALTKTGTNVTLAWPTQFADYQLQSATNLAVPIFWSDVSQTRATNGGQLSVVLPASAQRQFFRLKK
ncbi:MAG: hypothetical protein EPO07_15300 [Verrucomicrobia bacterium]|nr:MAG: hypothetical protein EPO07_15300 [Verrucomicrobiota bacterium]